MKKLIIAVVVIVIVVFGLSKVLKRDETKAPVKKQTIEQQDQTQDHSDGKTFDPNTLPATASGYERPSRGISQTDRGLQVTDETQNQNEDAAGTSRSR